MNENFINPFVPSIPFLGRMLFCGFSGINSGTNGLKVFDYQNVRSWRFTELRRQNIYMPVNESVSCWPDHVSLAPWWLATYCSTFMNIIYAIHFFLFFKPISLDFYFIFYHKRHEVSSSFKLQVGEQIFVVFRSRLVLLVEVAILWWWEVWREPLQCETVEGTDDAYSNEWSTVSNATDKMESIVSTATCPSSVAYIIILSLMQRLHDWI